MNYSMDQFSAQITQLSQAGLQNSLKGSQESEKLAEASTQDALWRMAQNNEMAKLKGFNKLAEAANQMS